MRRKGGVKYRVMFPVLLSSSFGILILTMLVSLLLTDSVLAYCREEISKMVEADARIVYQTINSANIPENESEWRSNLDGLPMLSGMSRCLFLIDEERRILVAGAYMENGTLITEAFHDMPPAIPASGMTDRRGTSYYYCFYPITPDGMALGFICSRSDLLASYTQLLSQIASVALVLFAVSFLACFFLTVKPMQSLLEENNDLLAESEKKDLMLAESYLQNLLSGQEEFLDFPQFLLVNKLPVNFEDSFYLSVIVPRWQEVSTQDCRDIISMIASLVEGYFKVICFVLQKEKAIVTLMQFAQKNDVVNAIADVHEQLNIVFSRPLTTVLCDEDIFIEDFRTVYLRLQTIVPMSMFSGASSFLKVSEDQEEYHRSITNEERGSIQSKVNRIAGRILYEQVDAYEEFLHILKKWHGYWPAYEEVLLLIKSGLEEVALLLGVSKGSHLIPIDFSDCMELCEVEARLREILSVFYQEASAAPMRRQAEYAAQIDIIIRECALKSDFSMQQIAETMGLSATYLSRIYKQSTGKTVADEIVKLRLQESARLLTDRSIPISGIYERVGYTTNNYFYRVFRKAFGVTPKVYRDLDPEIQKSLLSRTREEMNVNE